MNETGTEYSHDDAWADKNWLEFMDAMSDDRHVAETGTEYSADDAWLEFIDSMRDDDRHVPDFDWFEEERLSVRAFVAARDREVRTASFDTPLDSELESSIRQEINAADQDVWLSSFEWTTREYRVDQSHPLALGEGWDVSFTCSARLYFKMPVFPSVLVTPSTTPVFWAALKQAKLNLDKAIADACLVEWTPDGLVRYALPETLVRFIRNTLSGRSPASSPRSNSRGRPRKLTDAEIRSARAQYPTLGIERLAADKLGVSRRTLTRRLRSLS